MMNLAQTIDNKWTPDGCKIDGDNSFSFTFVSEDEIRNLVKNIDICKWTAIENLNSRIVKDLFQGPHT